MLFGGEYVISGYRLDQLRVLIAQGREHEFYDWPEWRREPDGIRHQVLRLDRWECQCCKRKGRYRKAVIVHHVKHLKVRPDLALSIFDGEDRQLESVCKSCHEDYHPESQRQKLLQKPPVTEERWD